MNINGAFPSKYLKAADLQGRHIAVTIAKVEMEEFDDSSKAIVYFTGKEKGLVLNKTNANMIVEITGSEETEEWKGQRIALYPTKVDFQGKRVEAIRVDYPEKSVAGQQAKPATPPPAEEPDFNDADIPF